MFGRTVARFLITLALLAASVAWLGWLFLHTAGDPTRSDRIAHAILDNPAARHEVAVDIADALAGATNKVLTAHHLPAVADGADPALQSAVDASLADPRIAANLVDAISAEHAEALGETPAHPPAIDTALLVTAVRAHLLPVEPALARAIPAVGPAAIKLPTAHIPFARQVRTAAKRWVGILALGAVAGLLAALLLGDRAQVLRRAGWWAIGAGLSWAIVPRRDRVGRRSMGTEPGGGDPRRGAGRRGRGHRDGDGVGAGGRRRGGRRLRRAPRLQRVDGSRADPAHGPWPCHGRGSGGRAAATGRGGDMVGIGARRCVHP